MVGPPSLGRQTGRRVLVPRRQTFSVRSLLRFIFIVPACVVVAFAQTHEPASPHADPVVPVVLALAIILAAAKLAGHISVRMGQPAVLGELIAGVILGSADLAGIGWFHGIESDPTIDVLARLGVVILLFEVGLESTVRDMLKVGLPSLGVAVLGVVAPFVLGWAISAWMLPDRSVYLHAFLGATLTATSVGITARVLQDLGQSQSPEARVILGAAVIDDVLGLVVLAIVADVIASANASGSISYGEIGAVLGKAAAFLFGALALGVYLSPRLFGLASRLRGHGILLVTALVFCFVLAYLASMIGLAPIVGAYAAGLILEDAHFRDFTNRGEHQLEHLVQPVATLLVPVFFVVIGMRVDLTVFARLDVLTWAAGLTVAAIAGKQVCSLAAVGRPLDGLSIGIGMIPRGEVGLIFANIGLGLTIGGERLLDEGIFSAVVIMVIVTTVVTPPALKWSLSRKELRNKRFARL